MNTLKFCFYFCLKYALIITFCNFDLSFLKIMVKSTLYGILQGNVHLLFSIPLKQNEQFLHYPFKDLFVYVS